MDAAGPVAQTSPESFRGCTADFQSAGGPLWTELRLWRSFVGLRQAAEWNSAIQQSKTLRYVVSAKHVPECNSATSPESFRSTQTECLRFAFGAKQVPESLRGSSALQPWGDRHTHTGVTEASDRQTRVTTGGYARWRRQV